LLHPSQSAQLHQQHRHRKNPLCKKQSPNQRQSHGQQRQRQRQSHGQQRQRQRQRKDNVTDKESQTRVEATIKDCTKTKSKECKIVLHVQKKLKKACTYIMVETAPVC
jgi:Mg-chelatase subunit ChlI